MKHWLLSILQKYVELMVTCCSFTNACVVLGVQGNLIDRLEYRASDALRFTCSHTLQPEVELKYLSVVPSHGNNP